MVKICEFQHCEEKITESQSRVIECEDFDEYVRGVLTGKISMPRRHSILKHNIIDNSFERTLVVRFYSPEVKSIMIHCAKVISNDKEMALNKTFRREERFGFISSKVNCGNESIPSCSIEYEYEAPPF